MRWNNLPKSRLIDPKISIFMLQNAPDSNIEAAATRRSSECWARDYKHTLNAAQNIPELDYNLENHAVHSERG